MPPVRKDEQLTAAALNPWAGDSRECGVVMCEKCAELDRRISLLRAMMENMSDPSTVESANKLIHEMEAQKAGFHPE
jgi:hypothetical protein